MSGRVSDEDARDFLQRHKELGPEWLDKFGECVCVACRALRDLQDARAERDAALEKVARQAFILQRFANLAYNVDQLKDVREDIRRDLKQLQVEADAIREGE